MTSVVTGNAVAPRIHQTYYSSWI